MKIPRTLILICGLCLLSGCFSEKDDVDPPPPTEGVKTDITSAIRLFRFRSDHGSIREPKARGHTLWVANFDFSIEIADGNLLDRIDWVRVALQFPEDGHTPVEVYAMSPGTTTDRRNEIDLRESEVTEADGRFEGTGSVGVTPTGYDAGIAGRWQRNKRRELIVSGPELALQVVAGHQTRRSGLWWRFYQTLHQKIGGRQQLAAVVGISSRRATHATLSIEVAARGNHQPFYTRAEVIPIEYHDHFSTIVGTMVGVVVSLLLCGISYIALVKRARRRQVARSATGKDNTQK